MKATVSTTAPPAVYSPISLTLTFETKKEADYFATLFNYSPICDYIRSSTPNQKASESDICAVIRKDFLAQGVDYQRTDILEKSLLPYFRNE